MVHFKEWSILGPLFDFLQHLSMFLPEILNKASKLRLQAM